MTEKVCVFVFKKTMRGYEFLLLKRPQDHGDMWQPVTGHIEKGEQPLDAAKREVEEETGIDEISRIIDPEYYYEFKKDNGKLNREYLYGFEVSSGYEDITISDEHVNYSWINLDIAKEMLVYPNHKEGLEKIKERGNL